MGGGASASAGARQQAADASCLPTEEYDAVYTEWGQLGVTIQTTDDGISRVVHVNDIARAAGVALGSHLLSVNGESVIGVPHRQCIDLIAGASWPKTLRFSTTDLEHARRVERLRQEQQQGGASSETGAQSPSHAQISLQYGGGKAEESKKPSHQVRYEPPDKKPA